MTSIKSQPPSTIQCVAPALTVTRNIVGATKVTLGICSLPLSVHNVELPSDPRLNLVWADSGNARNWKT